MFVVVFGTKEIKKVLANVMELFLCLDGKIITEINLFFLLSGHAKEIYFNVTRETFAIYTKIGIQSWHPLRKTLCESSEKLILSFQIKLIQEERHAIPLLGTWLELL